MVVEAVVEVAAAVFRALVDEGEVVAVDDLYRGEGGERGEVFQVLSVQTQAVFARAFFDAEQVGFVVFFDAGDEAQVGLVVGDEVARLVFAETFAASQEVDAFEQRGFAAAVFAADEGAARVQFQRGGGEVAQVVEAQLAEAAHLLSLRYCRASARCARLTVALSARSAMVRATLRMRW